MRHRVEQTRQTFKCSDKGLQSRRDQISRFFFSSHFVLSKMGGTRWVGEGTSPALPFGSLPPHYTYK